MVAVFATLAGGFAVVSISSGGQSGAASAEGALEGFVDALGRQDLIGMLEMLDPAERDLLVPLAQDLQSNLSRLGITQDMNLRDVPGIRLEVEGLQVASHEVTAGMAEVWPTAGLVRYETVPDAVPVGDVLRGLIEGTGGEVDIPHDAGQDRLAVERRVPGSDDGFLIATETDGRWHLSLAFTAAEHLRREAGLALPDMNGGIVAAGAESPEAAVEQLADAVADLDVAKMIALLPPDSMRAVQVYAPLFLDDLRQDIEELKHDEGFHATVDHLELETGSVRGGTRVVPTALTVTFTTFEEGTSTVALDGDCFEVTGDLAVEMEEELGDATFCADEVDDLVGEDVEDDVRAELEELWGLFEDLEPGVVAVQRDGAWYIDPIHTFTDLLVQLLEGVDRADLEEGGILYRLITGEAALLDSDLFERDYYFDDDGYDHLDDHDYFDDEPYVDDEEDGNRLDLGDRTADRDRWLEEWRADDAFWDTLARECGADFETLDFGCLDDVEAGVFDEVCHLDGTTDWACVDAYWTVFDERYLM